MKQNNEKIISAYDLIKIIDRHFKNYHTWMNNNYNLVNKINREYTCQEKKDSEMNGWNANIAKVKEIFIECKQSEKNKAKVYINFIPFGDKYTNNDERFNIIYEDIDKSLVHYQYEEPRLKKEILEKYYIEFIIMFNRIKEFNYILAMDEKEKTFANEDIILVINNTKNGEFEYNISSNNPLVQTEEIETKQALKNLIINIEELNPLFQNIIFNEYREKPKTLKKFIEYNL